MKPVSRLLQGLFCWLLITAVLVLAGSWVGSARSARHRSDPQNLIGKTIRCSSSINPGPHAEVLAYGFEDPRGVAYDQTHDRIIVADGARQQLISYSIANAKLEVPNRGDHGQQKDSGSDGSEYCPEAFCEDPDARGLVVVKGYVYLVQHGHGRISRRPLSNSDSHDAENNRPYEELSSAFRGPSAIVLDSDGATAYIADDHPWPEGAGEQTSAERLVVERRLDQSNEAHRFGALYQFDISTKTKPKPIDIRLPHPSGLALSPNRKNLYVSTCEGQYTEWLTFRRQTATGEEWSRGPILARLRNTGACDAPYLGMVTDPTGNVYAAGPGGIYIFDSAGQGLGRMEFNDRVSGLAFVPESQRGGWLYFAEGHALCRILVRRENP